MTHAADDSYGLAVVEDVGWLRVDDPSSPGTVRRRLAELARQVGFSETRTGEVGIVATELATNLVKHARDGAVLLRLLRSDGVGGVEIVAVDSGPGMRDPKAVFADGRSTAGTLGIGLGAVARLSSRYDVHSTPGHRVAVTTVPWRGCRAGTTSTPPPATAPWSPPPCGRPGSRSRPSLPRG